MRENNKHRKTPKQIQREVLLQSQYAEQQQALDDPWAVGVGYPNSGGTVNDANKEGVYDDYFSHIAQEDDGDVRRR